MTRVLYHLSYAAMAPMRKWYYTDFRAFCQSLFFRCEGIFKGAGAEGAAPALFLRKSVSSAPQEARLRAVR